MYKNKKWLKDQYWCKEKSCVDIAKEQNVDPKTIWSWMKKHGLKTRSRGAESSPGTFKKGHKNWLGKNHTEETKEKIRQARLEDGHVPYLKNGEHWMKSYNREDHGMWKGGVTEERQSVYSTVEWSNVVKKVWERDNAICQRCGKHHNTTKNRGTFHIHHIAPFEVEEKRTDVDNLVLLCRSCHHWVHSKKNKNNKFIEND